MGNQMVAVNEAGRRVGEDHPNAKLKDRDIDLIRDLHEQQGLSYSKLALRFGLSRGAIAKICRYERRGQYPASFRRVPV